MIGAVRIQHYRGLRDVSFRLGPLTVLVGANASGKSSILRALADTTWDDRWVWRRGAVTSAQLHIDGDVGHHNFHLRNYTRPYSFQYVQFAPDELRKDNRVFGEARVS
jgi:predicted ATPase